MVKRMLKAMKRRVSEVVGAMGLHPVVKQVRKARLTYLSNPKMHQIQRELLALERKQIKGAMVEFGLALGGSGIVEARLAPKREFHGFDVFAMIPPPTATRMMPRARSATRRSRPARAKVWAVTSITGT